MAAVGFLIEPILTCDQLSTYWM